MGVAVVERVPAPSSCSAPHTSAFPPGSAASGVRLLTSVAKPPADFVTRRDARRIQEPGRERLVTEVH